MKIYLTSWLIAITLFGSGIKRSRATPITDVFADLNHIHKWDDSSSDTADPFWADDGNLYAFGCDGRGFGTASKNLVLDKLVGPDLTHLTGSLVNPMSEYGAAGQTGPDQATWKVCGQECIDGVFYAFVARNTYGDPKHDPLYRQTSVNASLIKSTDHGLTWTRGAQQNYDAPMWPGGRFGAPGFIHYGQNGGAVKRDEADRYVYAISNNGFWNGGDDFILARVLRSDLPQLRATDWTYFNGDNGRKANGWTKDIGQAAPLLRQPQKCGWTSPCYIPALGAYVLVSWYVTPTLTKWFEPQEVKYDFYQAEHPWGTWRFISSLSDRFLAHGSHMYGPNLCAKFQEQQDGEVKVALFTSGCPFNDAPESLYKLWTIPIILKTRPLPPSIIINDDDPRITYSGTWQAAAPRGLGDYHDDAHYTNVWGATAECAFTGTGIDFITEKDVSHGEVDVFLDGTFKETLSLRLKNFPRISQVVVFQARNLAPGRHTIRLVNKSPDYTVVDAFHVYTGHN